MKGYHKHALQSLNTVPRVLNCHYQAINTTNQADILLILTNERFLTIPPL